MRALVLAAGLGTRMKSTKAKMLHNLCGKPVLGHVLDGLYKAGAGECFVIVGEQREAIRRIFANPGITFIVQEEQKGTGHAAMQAVPALEGLSGDLLVTYGDVPLVLPETYGSLVRTHRERGASATVLTSVYEDPGPYGRIIRDEEGRVRKVVEVRDASPEEKLIREVNTGIYVFEIEALLKYIGELNADNDQEEYYLTDMIEILTNNGEKVEAVAGAENIEVLGINSREELSAAASVVNTRKLKELMAAGVTFADPSNTWVEQTVTVGMDTVIGQCCVLEESTIVGSGVSIGPFTYLKDARVDDGAEVGSHSLIDSAKIGKSEIVESFTMLSESGRKENR